jgi:transposase
VPALPSSVPEPLWVQVAALLPTRQVRHPLGCHRPRIADRVVFDKLIQVLVFGCGYRRIADHTCSATTLRRRREEWISTGVAQRLRLEVLAADDQLVGLELEQLAVDGCTTRRPAAARPPGPARWTAANKGGNARSPSRRAASRWPRCRPRPTSTGDGLLAATLDALEVVGPLPAQLVVHLDAGYDYQPCRQVLTERGMVGQIATRGLPAPIQAGRRWVIERPHAWGNQDGKQRWCTERRRLVVEFWLAWPTPPSSVAAWSAAPGPTTAGTAAHAAAHDRLLAQALSDARPGKAQPVPDGCGARGGARLFDPVGVEYEPSRDGLRRADVLRLVKTGELPVATHNCGEGVAWLPPNQASAAWASVEADFEDIEGWRPPPGAPGALPYRAGLWRALRGQGQALVLRND